MHRVKKIKFFGKKFITQYVTHRRTYKILTTINPDPYYEEAWSYHRSKGLKKWKKKTIYKFKYREYRTWKYNRKIKWK